MQKVWNDCIKIYENNEFITDVDMEMFNAYNRYINVIHREPKLDVWYDLHKKVCFGPEQNFYKKPDDFSFFSQRENFEENPNWGKSHVLKLFQEPLGGNLIETKEYMIQDHEEFKKYENKTILMFGGGPSTNDVDWETKDIDYDYVWSCNNFFMKSNVDDLKVSLASLGPTVDLKDEKLIEYVKKHNTLCTFEGGISPFRKHKELREFKENFPNQVAYFHLRYFSKLGTLARLVCLATLLKAKKIYFVGMDGYPGKSGDKYRHAFENASLKTKTHGGRIFSYDVHRRQYVMLWNYLLNNLKKYDVEYQNLGEGHSTNLSSEISRNEFPLQI